GRRAKSGIPESRERTCGSRNVRDCWAGNMIDVNSKHEYRNTRSAGAKFEIRNSKPLLGPKYCRCDKTLRMLSHSSFVFVSDFEIRISDFLSYASSPASSINLRTMSLAVMPSAWAAKVVTRR